RCALLERGWSEEEIWLGAWATRSAWSVPYSAPVGWAQGIRRVGKMEFPRFAAGRLSLSGHPGPGFPRQSRSVVTKDTSSCSCESCGSTLRGGSAHRKNHQCSSSSHGGPGPIQMATHGPTCALLGAILAIMIDCASLRSAAGAPITDINQIIGKWAGTITPGHNSVTEPFYLTITPDGRLVAEWGVDTSWGTVTLRNGQATFEMKPPIAQGSIRLYVESGKRTLVMDAVLPSFLSQVTPQA